MKTFYLIDGHAQLFRAYYAPFRDLTSPSGEPVKAVYVFTQMMLTLLRNEKPDYLAVAFDVSDSTTKRKHLYPEYKANRDRSPADLHQQFVRVQELLAGLRVPTFELEGYEADDLIATIAERLAGQDVELRIASKDKDLHQIVTPTVKLWDPSSGELLDDVVMRAEKGYGPEHAVEIQTLVGDTIDNVPGARGVGVKTAAKLIAEYGTADAVVAHADELTPKRRENILEHAPRMDLTRELVTLDRNVPMEFELEACRVHDADMPALEALFDELGFRTFGEQFGALAGAGEAAPEPAIGEPATTAHVVTTEEELDELVRALAAEPAFAFDTETTSISAVDAEIVGYAFSWSSGEGWYVPVRGLPVADGAGGGAGDGAGDGAAGGGNGHESGDAAGRASGLGYLDPELVAERLAPVLADETTLKVGQNLKYDINVLAAAGLSVGGPLFDTMVAAALLHPNRRTNNMDDLARDLLNLKTKPITELIGKGKKQRSMLEVPLPDVAYYAAEDADVTWRLYEHLSTAMRDAPEAMQHLFADVEMPLVRVLADMERAGVEIDSGLLHEFAGTLGAKLEELRAKLYVAAGDEFNPDSPKQLAEVLFDKLGLPVVKKTKTGRSTDAGVLDELAALGTHPLPELVLSYRELNKLLGTYVVPLPSYLARTTGRLHASFHQTGAATGRLSSSDPNIQNIPIRSDLGREIRRAFRASVGKSLVTADYSQVELRMLAHYSQDEELARAFLEGLDIHAYVASQIFGVDLQSVTADQRRVAKTVNFGIVYGQSAFGLARTLHIPQSEAAAFIEAYKAKYTGLERFLARCVKEAEANGYVTTILGRRRDIDEIRSRNWNIRQLGERLAINTVIQGSAADLIKVAMVRLHERLARDFEGAEMLIQVHDELVLEAPDEMAEEVKAVTVDVMANALPLDVPLKVDAAIGPNWLEGKG